MTSEVLYITALTMGLLGSLHCMGMCGPIVLVLHGKRPLLSKLFYHAGRISIYSFIGILIDFPVALCDWRHRKKQFLSLPEF